MDRVVRRLGFALMVGLGAASAAAADAAGERAGDRVPDRAAVLKTWHPWQLDSILAAWAIRQARGAAAPAFESVERGSPLAPEVAIDTPDSPYRRTAQRTAFDEAVRLEGIESHRCVAPLREAVRIVELAPWRKAERPAVDAFEARVLSVLPLSARRGGLEAAFAEVERYCDAARGRAWRHAPSSNGAPG